MQLLTILSTPVHHFSTPCVPQVFCDPPDGGRPEQHSEMSEAHRRPCTVSHLPDTTRFEGEATCNAVKIDQWITALHHFASVVIRCTS